MKYKELGRKLIKYKKFKGGIKVYENKRKRFFLFIFIYFIMVYYGFYGKVVLLEEGNLENILCCDVWNVCLCLIRNVFFFIFIFYRNLNLSKNRISWLVSIYR